MQSRLTYYQQYGGCEKTVNSNGDLIRVDIVVELKHN